MDRSIDGSIDTTRARAPAPAARAPARARAPAPAARAPLPPLPPLALALPPLALPLTPLPLSHHPLMLAMCFPLLLQPLARLCNGACLIGIDFSWPVAKPERRACALLARATQHLMNEIYR